MKFSLITKRIVALSMFACLLISSLMIITSEVEAYSTNFDDSTYTYGWTILGDKFTTPSNNLVVTGLLRNEDDMCFIPYHAPSREVDLNYTISVSSADTSKSRLNAQITNSFRVNTSSPGWNTTYFKATVTGYAGQLSIDYMYNGSILIGQFTISTSTSYNIHLSCNQAQNGTYYLIGKGWTSGGSFASPDKGNFIYWLSYVPEPWKYVIFNGENSGTADGAITATITSLAMHMIGVPATTNSITWTESSHNNIFVSRVGEPTTIMNGTTLEMWIVGADPLGTTNPPIYMWYCESTNAPNYDVFTTPVKTDITGGIFRIDIVKYNNYYYLMATKGDNKGMYMWYSVDKIHWTITNSGNPVWDYKNNIYEPLYNTYNPGLILVNNTLHCWLECGYHDNFILYSKLTMPAGTPTASTSFDFEANASVEPVLNQCNVGPVYVPAYNAFILFVAVFDEPTMTYIQIKAFTVNANANLSDSASYKLSNNLTIGTSEPTSASDAEVVINGDTTLLYYFKGQPVVSEINQIRANLNNTQLYEMLVFGEIITPEPEEPEEPSNPSDYLKVGKVLIILAGAIPFIGFILWALGKDN